MSDGRGVRVAVEGCGHGTLKAIYASVAESCKQRGWDKVDLLIIGGDFQACRNAADLTIMSCPVKYRQMGDFHLYYSGQLTAPYLTIFIGGNHEASSHLRELYYGGWVAPNIYYMGAANVLRLGPLRIAGLSGIWKGHDYNKPHMERLPFTASDVKTFYHVREFDVRKLLLLQTQVDVGLSHDWPRAIEKWGDAEWLFRKKPDFRAESRDGTLGSVAAKNVMDRLRPPYWFSAHMHVKFAAVKTYEEESKGEASTSQNQDDTQVTDGPADTTEKETNPDEIDLGMDEEDADDLPKKPAEGVTTTPEQTASNKHEVSEDLRAQLPASFAPPPLKHPRQQPGQPVPAGIPNKQCRFLALDKCLPGRHYLQLCEIRPHDTKGEHVEVQAGEEQTNQNLRLQYDPEWLAITRALHAELVTGDATTQDIPSRTPHSYSPEEEEQYLEKIQLERVWVEENVVRQNKLDVPENFVHTAEAFQLGEPEIVEEQPDEYTNPQTVQFCELLQISNLWDASEEERAARKATALSSSELAQSGRGRGGRGRGRGDGRGPRGRGRGRGQNRPRW